MDIFIQKLCAEIWKAFQMIEEGREEKSQENEREARNKIDKVLP